MGGEYHLHSRPVKLKTLVETVIGLANSPNPLESSEVVSITDKSEAYTRAVIQLGIELELLQEGERGYVANPEIQEEARKMSPDQGFVLLNRYAQRYNPFMTYLSFIDKGFDQDRTAQMVKTLYEIDTPVEVISKQFRHLGKEANLLEDTDELSLAIETGILSTNYIEDLEEALKSEARARLYVHESLGEEVTVYVDEESIEKFQEALLSYRESPDNAIVNTVVGAENITRELAVDEGDSSTDYSKANGIGSLANMMRGDSLILKRHLHSANYLGAMRIPGAHGKESETLESWQVDAEVSLEVILSSLSYVRSIYLYIKQDRQVL